MFEAAIRPQASCNNFRISEDINFMERHSSIIIGSLDCKSESHSVLLKFILFPFFKPVWLP